MLEVIPLDNGKSELKIPEVKEFLEETVGEEGVDVVLAIIGRELTDEALSEETGLKLNIVRKILYQLYDYRLASYVRTKDKEIGWYIYRWKLDLSKIEAVITARKQRILKELNQKLKYETNHVFFCCTNDKSKIPFDLASECGFKCPHCDGSMEFYDNQSLISSLEEEIQKLEQELQYA
ncbi:MAG: transcription factor E [Candidatus Hydrothermarchaeales archaeon]